MLLVSYKKGDFAHIGISGNPNFLIRFVLAMYCSAITRESA